VKHSIRAALVVILIVSFAAGPIEADVPIPFSLKRGIPEIEVIINDSIKASFVIDTGADHIYIDKIFADKHGLLSGRIQPMRPTRGSKGSTEAKLFSVESLKFGDQVFSDLSMVAIDLVSQIKDTSKGYPDGVLGYSFLKNYQLRFANYPRGWLSKDSIGYKNSIAMLYDSVSFDLERHFIVVDVRINGTTDAKFILDTGSSYSIFSPELAIKLGYLDSLMTITAESILLNDVAWRDSVVVLVRDISDVSEAIKNPLIEGILGTSFLKGHSFIIDYSRRNLYFVIIRSIR